MKVENETTFSVPAVRADGKPNLMTSFTHRDCVPIKVQEGGSKNNMR